MKVEKLIDIIGSDFYVGVPDSQLRSLCDCLMDRYGIDKEHHIIGVNEGNCTAIAAGYNLATGKIPVVYMQNSGEGNVINPVASLLNKKVYGIPMIFIIGWRGEPGVHDEPQHIFQGEITCKLLEDVDIRYYTIDCDTTENELTEIMKDFRRYLLAGEQIAFIVKKGALTFDKKIEYANSYVLNREEIIEHIVKVSGNDLIISTTGKISRELFEIREKNHFGHANDFLTVGSMGHSSSIGLGVALSKPQKRVWCIDGDGAALMHMGAMAVIGAYAPSNMIHIVINNGAHETVGGFPTVAGQIDLLHVALSCGYSFVKRVDSIKDLDLVLKEAKEEGALCFIEVVSAIGSRADLGRPTTTPIENKNAFIANLRGDTWLYE